MIELGAAILVVTTAVLSAYTGAFQETTMALSTRARDLMPHEARVQGGSAVFQGALTPQAQNNRNVAQFILIPATIAYGWVFWSWAGVLGLGIGGLILRSILAAVVMPRPMSEHYVRVITANLYHRRKEFEKAGEWERVQAVDMTLDALQDLEPGMSELEWVAKIRGKKPEA